MTRQQDAERRLFDAICPMGDVMILASDAIDLIAAAIAADPSLMEAFAPMTLSEHCAKAGIKLPTDMGENNG